MSKPKTPKRKPAKRGPSKFLEKFPTILPTPDVNWPFVQEKLTEVLRTAIAPFMLQIDDALRRANMPKCPRCRRPQSPGDVTWLVDKAPSIKCPCGHVGSASA